jgi:Xaa-Pro dipeptidase
VELADVDLAALRSGRLARLQTAMAERDVACCLLFNEPNIRYATGASTMPIWSLTTFVRCALVPARGRPILFEHPNSVHLSSRVADDVRPMRAWEFTDTSGDEATAWARETLDAMRELGVDGDRLAVDRVGVPGFLALQRLGVEIVDALPVTRAAREVKTREELAIYDVNGPIVLEMLAAFEDAIAPGVRERDLLATMSDVLLRRGGEYLATSTVCSGPNTNPWRSEATDRVLEDGDLVWVDTDTVGVEGAFLCVSRTFAVGDVPSAEQRAIYGESLEWLRAMEGFVRPGMTCAEIAERGPRVPGWSLEQRYEVMIHSLGLEEESPSVAHPGDLQPNPDRVIEPNMVLCIELYAGKVGARDGVKLGDVVVVTDDGVRVVVPYPFDAALGSAGVP